MEVLFKTTNKYTFNEYKKYNFALMKNKMIILVIIIEVACILLAMGMQNLFFLIFAVVYPIMIFVLQNISIKKVYQSNKIMQDIDVDFEFYEDYFKVSHKNGETKIEYIMINKMIETKTNIYLMIAQNQGYMILKENMSEELLNFIHETFKKK